MSASDVSSTGRAQAKLHDVAARAQVSTGTVSNFLNHPDRLAPATRARVEAAISDLNFSRHGPASSLASGVSNTLGLVVVDLMNSLFVDITRGAQEAARERGFNLQLADSANHTGIQATHLQFLQSARVGGVMLAPLHGAHESIQTLRRSGTPVVLLNYAAPGDDCCTVLVDNEQVGYLAAQHLIALGRKRIAFVGGRHDVQPVRLRRKGVLRAVAETQGRVQLIEVDTADFNPPSGAVAGTELAAMPGMQRPDAVLAVTDLLAMAIINELLAADIRVPSDIAVMGCDHNSSAWGGAIPLTSVTMRGHDMGRAAVGLVLDEMTEGASGHEHTTIVLEPALEVRESTVGRRGRFGD